MDKYVLAAKKLILDFMRNEDAKIYLFGSRARNTAAVSSDIDVAIKYNGTSNRCKIAALRDELEESNIPYMVDIVDTNEAASDLLAEIEREGIEWK